MRSKIKENTCDVLEERQLRLTEICDPLFRMHKNADSINLKEGIISYYGLFIRHLHELFNFVFTLVSIIISIL